MIREARAMAQVSHPNVVAVYDVDVDADGSVLLAMELVDGITLKAWLAGSRSWSDVVAKFVDAGRGLEAAHAQGMLHRDFKPANVLVGRDGRVRVTDFGLARAPVSEPSLDLSGSFDDLAVDTLSQPLTQAGVVMGTPRYMAPEQHTGDLLTPATDQYAFCVTLWEALCGAPPFPKRRIERKKLEGPPPWPRNAVPAPIAAAIRRGLAPLPADRWSSMDALLTALSADPTARRKRLGRIAAAVALVGIAGAATFAGMGADVPPACPDADAKLAEVWSPERRAELESAIESSPAPYAKTVWDDIAPVLDDYAASWAQMHTEACEATTVRHEQSEELLDLRMSCLRRSRAQLAAAIETLATAEPNVLLRARGLVEGLPELSACADTEALRTGVPLPDAEDREVVDQIAEAFAQSEVAVAAGQYDRSLEILAKARAAAEGIDYPPIYTELQLRTGIAQTSLGEYLEAEAALDDAIERGVRWGQWPLVQHAVFQIVPLVGTHLERPDEAAAYEAMGWGFVRRDGRPQIEMQWRSVVSKSLADRGDLEAAEVHLREALRLVMEVRGPEHPHVGVIKTNLGALLDDRGQRREAEQMHRGALEVWVAAHGELHPHTAAAHNNLAASLLYQGDWAGAETQLRKAIEAWSQTVGADHPNVIAAKSSLSAALKFQGEFEEAEALMTYAVEASRDTFGPDDPRTASARNGLANLYMAMGRNEEAIAEHREALKLRQAHYGPDHLSVADSRDNMGMALYAAGRAEDAEPEFRAGLAVRLEELGPDHPPVGQSRANLGTLLVERGDTAEALEHLEPAWTIANSGEAGPDLRAEVGWALARAKWAAGDEAAAREIAKATAEACKVAGPLYDFHGSEGRRPAPHASLTRARLGSPTGFWSRASSRLAPPPPPPLGPGEGQRPGVARRRIPLRGC